MTADVNQPSGDRPPAWVGNPRDRAWVAPPPDPRPREFHRRLPGYLPTPLTDVPALAARLGVGRLFVKDESERLGLPAFKALGASWAVHRAVAQHGGAEPLTIVTATDGNHGRAIARFARPAGHAATIFVPDGVHPAAIEAIRDEGAEVVDVAGSYDAAVAAAAARGATPAHVLVQDTAWDGYTEIPGWIVDGYATLFAELDEQLAAAGVTEPTLVVVPTGVGSLLQAALTHYRQPGRQATAVVSVEPVNAACVSASVAAGRPTAVPTGVTSMAGLNCGTVSAIAWPAIAAGLDAALVTDDASCAAAVAELAALGIDAGPCGAAGLAALREALDTGFGEQVTLGRAATVVLLVTEGSAANPNR